MGGALGKKQGQGSARKTGEGAGLGLPMPGTSNSGFNLGRSRKNPLRSRNSLSEFNLTDLATNITHRFSVLSGLSFISFVSVPPPESSKRPWSRVSRKRWHPTTLQNEYAQCKTVWPVAQTEALFLPEFPVGTEEKLKLILLGEVSRGAFGQVFHVRCSSTHKEYAMKVLSKSQVCSLDAVRQVKQEVMIQHVCSHHPFIAPLTHFWQTRKLLIVMTEYIGYGELQQLWRSLGRLPENLLKLYVAEIALALDFLHNAGVIYRDLKMENILLDVDGHIKLIDFGLSRWLSYGGHTSTICGTLQFMAPEILKAEDYGHSADWWSLGIIAYSLLAGHYPISGYDDHVSMGGAVEKFVYEAPEGSSKAMKSLLAGLLERSPTNRIHTLSRLQQEEMFMHVDFDDVRDKKLSPRMALEKYIEGKSRRNFDEFEGLTSTPKKEVSNPEGGDLDSFSPLPKPSKSPLMGNRAIMWDRAKRSCSSPLLSSPLMHPFRLGHHDALVKSVSSSGYNGAAVPLLQSPLLRLARGQTPRNRRSQRAVSASALPTAVSPLLVNVTGDRKGKWQMRERERHKGRKEKDRETDSSSSVHSPAHVLQGMNGVYQKCVSEESVKEFQRVAQEGIKRSKTDMENPIGSPGIAPWTIPKEPQDPPLGGFLENGDDLDEEFFTGLITSTPKRESVSRRSAIQQNPQLKQTVEQLLEEQEETPFIKAVNPQGQKNKYGLINGALLGNRSPCNPLRETDFEDTLEHFPWISESLDT